MKSKPFNVWIVLAASGALLGWTVSVQAGPVTATVPDGGTTILLLGAALTGLAVIKRYLF